MELDERKAERMDLNTFKGREGVIQVCEHLLQKYSK